MMNEENKATGRNEACPCGSGKKYKRCHGVDAAPKLTAPSPSSNPQNGGPMFPQFDPSQLDPQWMMKFSQAMQRLPKGQLQKLQVMMQKAMAGKDITQEAMELERTLPPDFQDLLKSFQMPPEMMAAMQGAGTQAPGTPAAPQTPAMEVSEAERIVEEAIQSGKISKEEGEKLLQSSSEGEKGSFWKRWVGKK